MTTSANAQPGRVMKRKLIQWPNGNIGWLDYEEIDPAPGHEEQRESAGVYGTERSNPHPPLPTDSHPTIEQDRQAWRAWFGAYSEPVRKFGEHDA